LIWLLLFTIFCIKDNRSSCFVCNLVALGLSIIISILIINYVIKLEEENKINSEILKWILWFIISFGFATLFIFKDDCSLELGFYFLILITMFCTGYCCVKYNKKLY
jgi:hypothetical protein